MVYFTNTYHTASTVSHGQCERRFIGGYFHHRAVASAHDDPAEIDRVLLSGEAIAHRGLRALYMALRDLRRDPNIQTREQARTYVFRRIRAWFNEADLNQLARHEHFTGLNCLAEAKDVREAHDRRIRAQRHFRAARGHYARYRELIRGDPLPHELLDEFTRDMRRPDAPKPNTHKGILI
jgi:hypothetical protein